MTPLLSTAAEMGLAPEVPRRRHILTIVLEDYCHVGPVSRVIRPDYWSRFESRVHRNTQATLDLLDQVGAKATFFVLGWIGEHQPEVVAEVARRGHEIASKGFFHRHIDQMTPEQFREDVRRSRQALESAAGVAVKGYRVPRGGLGRRDLWALDILAEEGFDYDSSIRPLGVEFAGQSFRRFIHQHQHDGRRIWEVPLSTWSFGPFSVPISGGNYMRQLPNAFIRKAMATWDRDGVEPLVCYFHVWELDPEQPRISAVSALEHLRQYRNLRLMSDRIRYYLNRYRFGTIAEHLELPTAIPAATTAVMEGLCDVAVPVIDARAFEPRPAATRLPITVVVPCYNEEATLGYTANTLQSFADRMKDDFEISYVFVDDGSTDGTWRRLNELFGARPDCVVARHPRNRGVAAATLTGIRNSRTEVVCAIDCDGTHDPLQLRQMISMLTSDVDLVTASPYHPGGRVLNLAAWRLVLSKGLSIIYRFFHRHRLYTYTSCFRVYRRSAVAGMELYNERFVGITEILSRLDRKGGSIVECPAVMEVRLLGNSKMKVFKTIWGHLMLMSQLLGLGSKSIPSQMRIAKENYRDTAGHA
jgi:polysaccharide deacetylase family protein (PEP-CTERM system associated)